MAKPVVLLLAALTLVLVGATAVTASTDNGEPGQVLDGAPTPVDAVTEDPALDVDLQELLSKLRAAFRQQLQSKFEALKQTILERRASRQRREAEDLTITSTPVPQEVAPSTAAAADSKPTKPTKPAPAAGGRRHRKEKESSEEESSEREGRHGKGRRHHKDAHATKWPASVIDVVFGGHVEKRPLGRADVDGEQGGRRNRGRKNEEKWAFIEQLRARRKSSSSAAAATDAATPTGAQGKGEDA